MRKQSIALRQITHGTMLRRQAAERFPFSGQQAGEGAQQGGLAFAALPQQYGKSLDVEVDPQSHRIVDAVIDAHRLRTSVGVVKPNQASRAAASPPERTPTVADIPLSAR